MFSIVAAVALVASMIVFLVRIGSYLKGRELEQQMKLARQVQGDLLPRSCPECKEFEFSAECIPAWQVGGDYYDMFRTPGGQLTLTLGDVSGKGLPAALVMSLVNGAIRTSARSWTGQDLGELAAELNRFLLLRTSDERFLTLFWAICDPVQNRLYYVNAGHLPPFLIRKGKAATRQIERLETGGPVLGILTGASYSQGEVRFEPGDLLVLFSDGLVEATNEADEEFGEDRLLAILKRNGEGSIDQIKEQILSAVKEFSSGRAYHDDLTVLLASRNMMPESQG
jgi:sigma-B regulation protein RsbU (phosphoserine phosphatase)